MKLKLKKVFGLHGDLISGTVIAMFVRAFSALCSFVLSVVIARKLGASESGLFFLALSIVTVIATLSRFGLDNPLVKIVSAGAAVKNNYSIKPIAVASSKFVFMISLIMAVTIMLGSGLISDLFGKPLLRNSLWIMAMVIVPMACSNVFSSLQLGLKKILQSTMSATCLTPLFSLLIIAPIIFIKGFEGYFSLQYASWSYLGASLIAMFVAMYWCYAQFYKGVAEDFFTFKNVYHIGMPFYPIVIFQLLITWPAIWAVGYFCTSVEVALYSTAHKTSQLLALFLVSVNSIAAPKFSMLFAGKKIIELERVAKLSALVATASAVPIMIFYWIFSEEIMTLFGAEFRSAAILLKILTIGQLVNAITGPTAYILLMTGNEDCVRKATFIGGCSCIASSVFMTMHYGVVGGACAAAFSMALINILTAIYVYKRLKIITIPLVGNFFVRKHA